MSPRYSQHVSRTSNFYPATCVRQHVCIGCIRIHVTRRPGHNVSVQHVSWCKRGFRPNRSYYNDCLQTLKSQYDMLCALNYFYFTFYRSCCVLCYVYIRAV